METKRRTLEDPRLTASALRRLTQSSPRLPSLRRPSSTASSVCSLSSHEHEEPSSCVSRDTSHDECALNRFMVWAAVKRNACTKMTPEEKRECPLLRCRKRFPSHELMLQHLYTCEELAVGEYWCYDCAKVEQFSDVKCKRCLGHPSKRKKIMFMAKNFFSSLGHRSKTGSLPDLDLDLDEAPPSYIESFPDPPNQAELQSNEIHEIDSTEVSLATILEDEAEEEMELASKSFIAPPRPRLEAPVLTVRPAELETQWNGRPIVDMQGPFLPPRPPTLAPLNPLSTDQVEGFVKPILQLHTDHTDLENYRAQAKRRSKMLAPSSSVRSTASTASTNSTASTSSYNISPMSNWSGAWGRRPDFESTLTSPTDELFNDPFDTAAKSKDLGLPDLEGPFDDQFLTELPGDVPMTNAVPHPDPLAGLDLLHPFTFENTMVPGLVVDSTPTQANPNSDSQLLPQPPPESLNPTDMSRTNAHSLVGTAWGALQLHVAESMERLQHIKSNHLIDALRIMSPQNVASSGLAAMAKLVDGVTVDSAVELLSFVHVAYSLSLIVHEQDAPTRGANLFPQAVSYASQLSKQDRQAYLPVVHILWKPRGMTEDDVVGLIRSTSAASRSNSQKGKRPQQPMTGSSKDPLMFMAQFFLDELEYAAIHETSQVEVQASNVCVQHLKDSSLDFPFGAVNFSAVDLIVKALVRQHHGESKFVAKMTEFLNQISFNYGSTVRRLELDIMHIGKQGGTTTPRSVYHRHGVDFMDTIIKKLAPADATLNIAPKFEVDLDPLQSFDNLPTDLDDFDFSTDLEASNLIVFPESQLNPTVDSSSVSPESMGYMPGPSTAATTPPSPPQPQNTAAKVNSDSCCEICGYRPEGDPRWFPGSMAKHKKLQHATSPPKIYRCPFPGCTSQFKNRPDNLRQHQIKKNHFLKDDDQEQRRPNKRKKVGEED